MSRLGVKDNRNTTNPLLSDNLEDVLDVKLVWAPTEECAPWEMHDRGEDWYTEENSSDLIESIKVKGDQHIPGLIRRIPEGKYEKGDPLYGKKFEIIYGARRHFACTTNGVPVFKAHLCDYDDKKCLALMHIENSQRKDITPMERAKSIAAAYKKFWSNEGGTSYSKMAKEYHESKTTIYEYELAGRLWHMEEFKGVFSDMKKVPKTTAMKVASLWDSSSDVVIEIIEKLKDADLPDSVKAKEILNQAQALGTVKSELYSAKKIEFRDDVVGVVNGQVSEKGIVTIKLQATAGNANKKVYSNVVERVMSELGVRK